MKKVLFIAAIALAVVCTACGSKKKVPTVEYPCTEFLDNNTTVVRGWGTTESPNLNLARQGALAAARNEAAANMKTLVQSAFRQYTSQYTKGVEHDVVNKIDAQIVNSVNSTISSSPVCNKSTFDNSRNVHIYYVAVEVSTAAIQAAAQKAAQDAISQEEELMIDFQQSQFQDAFQQALAEFAAAN